MYLVHQSIHDSLFTDVLDSAFQRCVLCGLTGAGMTSLDVIFKLDPEALELICLCVLHFGLRIFSFLLKLGYHQTFKVSLTLFQFKIFFDLITYLSKFFSAYY